MYEDDESIETNSNRQSSSSSGTGGIFGLVIVVLLCWWGYNQFLKSDSWSLMYENQLGGVTNAGTYRSREECESKLQVARLNPNMGRPECGNNCRPPTTLNGPYVCDETFEL